MSVQFNLTQQAAAASPTAPQATVRQAGKDGEKSDSSISSSSSGKGFIATVLSPFKAIASFITSIFNKIFCCCGDSKEVKGPKDQKAALETFQKVVQAVADRKEVANYKAAVAALPKDLKDAILADLKEKLDDMWENGRENHQGYAELILNELRNIHHVDEQRLRPGIVNELRNNHHVDEQHLRPGIVIAVKFVQAALITVLDDIEVN